MPIDFDYDNDTVKVTFGKGDVGVGISISPSVTDDASLSLTDLGQSCCISASLIDALDKEDLDGRNIIIACPKTPVGLNSARIFLKGAFDLVKNIRIRLLDQGTPEILVEDVRRCLFCYLQEKETISLVEYCGSFICQDCIDHLHARVHSPSGYTLQEEYDNFKVKSCAAEEKIEGE